MKANFVVFYEINGIRMVDFFYHLSAAERFAKTLKGSYEIRRFRDVNHKDYL
jgi:hypothetical protein